MNDCWPLTLLAGSQTIVVNFDDLIFEKLAISYDCFFTKYILYFFFISKIRHFHDLFCMSKSAPETPCFKFEEI